MEIKFRYIVQNIAEKIFDKMQPKTCCGFDGISMKLLKESKNALMKPLTIKNNQTLNTYIFPDKLKIAKVNPINPNFLIIDPFSINCNL